MYDDKQNDPRYNFYAHPTVEELIRQQGKGPIHDVTILHGGWPEDEDVTDFINARREWRRECRCHNDESNQAA